MLSTLTLLMATAAAPEPAASPAPAAAPVPAALRACGDRSQFPPYTFLARDGKTVTGYNVDFLAEVLRGTPHTLHIELLPWKRCVAQAALGKYDIILDIAGTPERARDFRVVRAHYTITPIVVYDLARPIARFDTRHELAGIKRCEMLGWDYSATGLPRIADDLLSRPSTIESALAMLRAGRCQAMVYDLELLEGLRAQHGKAWTDGLGYHLIPWVPTYEMHLGVSHKLPHGAALQALLERGIGQMQRSGKAQRALERYLPR